MPSQTSFQQTGKRRTERAIFDATVMFRAGTRKASVKVRDISALGARISGVYLVRVDDRFFLTLPGLQSIEARVALSRSEPNWANAANSRYCAISRRKRPATCFMALIWAAPPTRETETPALMAGRMPE